MIITIGFSAILHQSDKTENSSSNTAFSSFLSSYQPLSSPNILFICHVTKPRMLTTWRLPTFITGKPSLCINARTLSRPRPVSFTSSSQSRKVFPYCSESRFVSFVINCSIVICSIRFLAFNLLIRTAELFRVLIALNTMFSLHCFPPCLKE